MNPVNHTIHHISSRNRQNPTSDSIDDTRLRIYLPITKALDTANSLIHTANSIQQFHTQYTLFSKALAIGRSLAQEIASPMTVIRPPKQDIEDTKKLLLLCHSGMIQILTRQDYVEYREFIHQHLRQIVRLLGHKLLDVDDARITMIFPIMRNKMVDLGWDLARRIREWLVIAATVPIDDYYVAPRFWSHFGCMQMEIDSLERLLEEGALGETKEAVEVMQVGFDISRHCLGIMVSAEGEKWLPTYHGFKGVDYYQKMGDVPFHRFLKIKRDLGTKLSLHKGDTLLALVKEGDKQLDEDYFRFQAMFALDAYRAAYQVCTGYEGVNFELEGLCLWSMGVVLGRYLGLEEQAHELFLQAVRMSTIVTGAAPASHWYKDSVENVERYRKRVEIEEMKFRQAEREGVMENLTFELFELQARSERVKNEKTLREFFVWLLRTHIPPSSRKIVERPVLESRDLGKVVLNVIAIYSGSAGGCDQSWTVLSEEIIKVTCIFQPNLRADSKSFLRELRCCILGSDSVWD